MQCTEIFSAVKIENFVGNFFIYFYFCEAVLTSTNSLCFGVKIRKIG